MNDLFNNCDVIISNASLKDNGLAPDDKEGLLILKPKEDSFYMAKKINGLYVEPGKEAIFQISLYDNYPIEFGVGIYADNSLKEMVYILRDNDNELFGVVNFDGDILTNRIPLLDKPHKLNTVALGYFNTNYIGFVNDFSFPITFTPPIFNEPTCFYVKFDTPLKALMLHSKLLDKEKRLRMTEKPNLLIKEEDE